MALITCPECGKQVSSFAKSCPQCGYPISSHSESSIATQPTAPFVRRDPPAILSQAEYKELFTPDKKQPVDRIVIDSTHRLFKLKEFFASIHSIDNILDVSLEESIDEETEVKPEFSVGFGKAYTGGLFQKKKKTRGFGTSVTFKKETTVSYDGCYIVITVAGSKKPKELKIWLPTDCKVGSSEHQAELRKARSIMSSLNQLRY